MSKPDDIPQDVWDLARRIWAEMLTVNHDAPQKHSFNDCDEIARAILAERERCAGFADQVRIGYVSSDYGDGFNDACNSIAAHIRGEQP